VLGGELAEELVGRASSSVVVLALPRGGLPVAAPLAARWSAPLGILVVGKVGAPGQPELAMGAVALVLGRVELVRNERVVRALAISDDDFEDAAQRLAGQLAQRALQLKSGPETVSGRTVLVVDDGLATGSTMLAAVTALRRLQPTEIVVAVPVGSAEAVALVGRSADAVVCPWVPEPFVAVGYAYHDFTQVGDDEVDRLLSRPQC
jgi:predicted phosphoribosyltransferase